MPTARALPHAMYLTAQSSSTPSRAALPCTTHSMGYSRLLYRLATIGHSAGETWPHSFEQSSPVRGVRVQPSLLAALVVGGVDERRHVVV